MDKLYTNGILRVLVAIRKTIIRIINAGTAMLAATRL